MSQVVEESKLKWDPEQNVWVWTGKVFTTSEQMERHNERFVEAISQGDYRNAWTGFLFSLKEFWSEGFEDDKEFNEIVDNLKQAIMRNRRQRRLELFAELARYIETHERKA